MSGHHVLYFSFIDIGNKDGLSLAAENNDSTLSRRPIYRNDLPKFIEKD